mmetsp:Transcript_150990/g.263061  ORF Transcript_150990/g.263061 Transcript_150990/m.263061 type:complete len:208 (-) Transcript_150990:1419-2042(-)
MYKDVLTRVVNNETKLFLIIETSQTACDSRCPFWARVFQICPTRPSHVDSLRVFQALHHFSTSSWLGRELHHLSRSQGTDTLLLLNRADALATSKMLLTIAGLYIAKVSVCEPLANHSYSAVICDALQICSPWASHVINLHVPIEHAYDLELNLLTHEQFSDAVGCLAHFDSVDRHLNFCTAVECDHADLGAVVPGLHNAFDPRLQH